MMTNFYVQFRISALKKPGEGGDGEGECAWKNKSTPYYLSVEMINCSGSVNTET